MEARHTFAKLAIEVRQINQGASCFEERTTGYYHLVSINNTALLPDNYATTGPPPVQWIYCRRVARGNELQPRITHFWMLATVQETINSTRFRTLIKLVKLVSFRKDAFGATCRHSAAVHSPGMWPSWWFGRGIGQVLSINQGTQAPTDLLQRS